MKSFFSAAGGRFVYSLLIVAIMVIAPTVLASRKIGQLFERKKEVDVM